MAFCAPILSLQPNKHFLHSSTLSWRWVMLQTSIAEHSQQPLHYVTLLQLEIVLRLNRGVCIQLDISLSLFLHRNLDMSLECSNLPLASVRPEKFLTVPSNVLQLKSPLSSLWVCAGPQARGEFEDIRAFLKCKNLVSPCIMSGKGYRFLIHSPFIILIYALTLRLATLP